MADERRMWRFWAGNRSVGMCPLPDALHALCFIYSLISCVLQVQLGTKHSPPNTHALPSNLPAPGGQLAIGKDKARCDMQVRGTFLLFREASRRTGHLCVGCSGRHHQRHASDLDLEEARAVDGGRGTGLAGGRETPGCWVQSRWWGRTRWWGS